MKLPIDRIRAALNHPNIARVRATIDKMRSKGDQSSDSSPTLTLQIGDADRPGMVTRREFKALIINPNWPRDLETRFRPADDHLIPADAIFSDLGKAGGVAGIGTPMVILFRAEKADPERAVKGTIRWYKYPPFLGIPMEFKKSWGELAGHWQYLTIGDIYKQDELEDPLAGTVPVVATAHANGMNGHSNGVNGHPKDVVIEGKAELVEETTELVGAAAGGSRHSQHPFQLTQSKFVQRTLDMASPMRPPRLTPTEYGMDLAMTPLERKHRSVVYGDLADKISSSYKWALGLILLAIVAIVFLQAGT